MLLKGTKSRIEEAKHVSRETGSKIEPEKANWTMLSQTRKTLSPSDLYVLGDQNVTMPPIVSSSSLKGVKARLVRNKKAKDISKTDIDAPTTEVVTDWVFDSDDQIKPIYFSNPVISDTDVWVEMLNESDIDAVVNATVHGMIKSKLGK